MEEDLGQVLWFVYIAPSKVRGIYSYAQTRPAAEIDVFRKAQALVAGPKPRIPDKY